MYICEVWGAISSRSVRKGIFKFVVKYFWQFLPETELHKWYKIFAFVSQVPQST